MNDIIIKWEHKNY